MTYEWIKAPLALAYVSDGAMNILAQRRICERAHAGLIAAKAERIVWNDNEKHDHPISKDFWWANGHEALEQDWRAGDFSTWIDHKVEVKAFGVSFDFIALSDLVPADKQATALRRFSVMANEEWISASDLYLAMQESVGLKLASAALAEACRLGQLGARAMRASCSPLSSGADIKLWQAVEWDVPLWFWRDFTAPGESQFSWSLGKVSGQGRKEGFGQRIELQGLHFHRSGLINLGLGKRPADTIAGASAIVADRIAEQGPGHSDSPKTPLSEAELQRWWESKAKVRDHLTKDELLALVREKYPDHHISRDRIRDLAGPRKTGPKRG